MGPADFITRAKESRNLMGGGMRQAGTIAACGIFALDHNVMRLAEDHKHARIFANILEESGFFQILNDPVQTNMVIFALKEESLNSIFTGELENGGVLIDHRRTPVLRAVTNLNHTLPDVEKAAEIVVRTAKKLRG
jgi:threonine aldolase